MSGGGEVVERASFFFYSHPLLLVCFSKQTNKQTNISMRRRRGERIPLSSSCRTSSSSSRPTHRDCPVDVETWIVWDSRRGVSSPAEVALVNTFMRLRHHHLLLLLRRRPDTQSYSEFTSQPANITVISRNVCCCFFLTV